MINEAVGIAINGREVKIAHVYRDKYRLAVDFLESAILTRDMEYEISKKAEETGEAPFDQNGEDIFAIKNPYETKVSTDKETNLRENVDVIYSLIRKFAARRVKVAFNVPPSRVTFQDLDTHLDYDKNVFRGSLKKKIERWKKGFNELDNVSVIARKDGTLCNVSCEIKQPPIIDILEQLNAFFKGNLFLSLMDPNETSLVNLARTSYDFHDPEAISVIVEIETEFSRLVFMKGEDLLTVSPIIPESFNPDIFNIIYSKINYELDNLNLPEITNILLAGKASTNTARAFFEKKFPTVRVGFIVSQPLAENLSTQFSREDLSDYAIPIALAWKVIQKKNENFIPTNLLPSQVIERQKMLTLNMTGYVILILLGISAFVMTWKITAKKIEVNSLRSTNKSLTERIASSEETVKKVQDLEDQINKLTKRIILSDSLSYGSDRLLSFLEKVNECILSIKSIWIDEVQNTTAGINLKGVALKRNAVPELSEALGVARIKKLTRFEIGGTKAFAFEMEVDWKQQPFQPNFRPPAEPGFLPPAKSGAVESKIVTNSISDGNSTITATQLAYADENVGLNSEASSSTFNPQSEKSSLIEKETARMLEEMNKSRTTSTKSKTENNNRANENTRSENFQSNRTSIAASEKSGQEMVLSESPLNGASHFTIKISAHASKFTATKEVEFLHSRGFETYITKFPGSSQEVPYWVCLGNFSSSAEAQQELSRLNQVVPGKRQIIELSTGIQPVRSSFTSPPEKIDRSTENPDPKLIKQANHTISRFEAGNSDANGDYQKSQNEDNNFSPDAGAGSITIAISAHVTRFTAKKEVAFFKSKGYDAFITTLANSSQEVPYWVCLGNFTDHQEAERKVAELRRTIPRDYDIVSMK